MAIDRQELIDATSGGILEPANGPFSPGQQGHLEDNGLVMEQDLDGAAALIEEYESETGQQVDVPARPHADPGQRREPPSCSSAGGREIGVDVTDQQVPQDQFITLALFGDPTFQAYLWRNHAGVSVDQQYFWWHSAGSHPDGELSLNFGRLDRPGDRRGARHGPRRQATTAEQLAAAEDVNQAFGEGCYLIPLSWTLWSVIGEPSRSRASATLVLPDGAKARDGAGFRGSVLDPDRLRRRRMT